MNRDIVRQAANVVALATTVAVNGLANALPINGQTTGAISDRFPVFFVPAGYVFSIWGVIYLALIGFVVYQALPRQRENPRLRRLGYLFVLSSILNVTWLLLWHYEVFPLTLVFMVSLLLSLIAIYRTLRSGGEEITPVERWFARLPFSIYLGWVSVATIANATQLLYWLGWNGQPLTAQAWAAIMLGVATVLGAIVAWKRLDLAFLSVLAWAFAGIGVKHAGDPLVGTTAWIATVAIALMIVATLLVGPRLRQRAA